METTLYIIGGVVAYLLIGAVVAGLVIRVESSASEDAFLNIWFWPIYLVIGIVYFPCIWLTKLAKRIGGMK